MEDTAVTNGNVPSLWRQAKTLTLLPPQADAAVAAAAGAGKPAAAAEAVPTTSSVAELAEEYHKLLDVVGTPNFETMQRLFAGDGAPPASTVPAIQVSFELFEAVQNRFAATKQVLERTKADLLTRNQHYSLLHQDMLRLKDEHAVLQKRISEAEERNTQLHQQRAKLEVTVEHLGREVAQGRSALDALRGKLVRRDEELQLSQSRVAESLVTLSQKEAVIGTLRRELGKCGHFRYGSASGVRDGARDGEDDGQADGGGGEGGNTQAYTAHMLDRIAADVEGRSQEARMKLNIAELEGRLSRLGEEKDSILVQHTQYRQHVQLALQTYEAEAMLREDTLGRHACVHTPYFAGMQEAVYAKLVNLQTGEELAAGQGGKDSESGSVAGAEAPPPPPLQSFGALAFEVRQLMDRLSKMHIDDASRLQQDLSLCVEAQRMSLQVAAEVVGFLSAMEEEVVHRRLTLPEVREEWRKARVPGFAQAIARSLRESGSRFGRGMVGLLQQENIFVAEVEHARRLQDEQQRAPVTGRNTSAASVAGGKGQQPQRRSRSDGMPGQNRSGVTSASGRRGIGSCSAVELPGEAESPKGSLAVADSVEELSALLVSGDGQGSDYAEKAQLAAIATAGSKTPPPTRSGGASVTSEAQDSSATRAPDMKVSPKGRLRSTTDLKDAVETLLAAASPAEAESGSALQSSKDAPASLATPPSTTRSGAQASAAAPSSTAPLKAVPGTTSHTDQLTTKSSLAAAAVAKPQVVGGTAALPVMPSVVMCPHCAHEVVLDGSTGESLPAPADGCGGGGTQHSLASPNAAAAGWHEASDKTGSASSPPAGSGAVSPAKSGESASATQGSEAVAATDIHRHGARHTESSAALTKLKSKRKLGSAKGATVSSSKRPKDSSTGSRSASLSPVQSRTTLPTFSRPNGTRASSKHSRPEGARPAVASDEKISTGRPGILIEGNTSQAASPFRRSKNNVGAATSAEAGTAAAELASALSDCQDRLTRTSQELQDVRAANAALQAQLIAALAAAAASAPATASSTPVRARGYQVTPHSSAAVDEELSILGKQKKKSFKSKVASSSSCTPPRIYDGAEVAAAKDAERALGKPLEADQFSTSVGLESPRGGRSASRMPPQLQSPHAGAQKDQLTIDDDHSSASAAGAAAGDEDGRAENVRGDAAPDRHPTHLPLTASSSASPSLPAGRREAVRPGVHIGEQTSTTDGLSGLAVTSARGFQPTSQLQQASSTAAGAKPMRSGSAEVMGSGAEKSCGGQAAGVTKSAHISHVTLQNELPSPSVSHTPQREYSKRAGGLAAAYAAQSQHDRTSSPTPIWGSAYPPVRNRRHNALTWAAASSIGTAGAATVYRANTSPASIPERTRELGLAIANSRVTGSPAKQRERVAPSRYVSTTSTKVKDDGHTNRPVTHTIDLAPTSVPLLRLTSGHPRRVLPSLPPLSPSQVPSSASDCPLVSGTTFSSPVPVSALPTIALPEDTYPRYHAATTPAATAASAAGLSVAGPNIVSLNLPAFRFSSMPQQSERARPPSPLSATTTTTLNKRQQRKIEIQQLHLCLDQDASLLYNSFCGAQSSTAAGALSNAQVARRRLGGVWYSTRSRCTGGGLHQVMSRRMRETWARGHLYEAPIAATPASVPTSDANPGFSVIVGGQSVASCLGEPCSASAHPPVRRWQGALPQSPSFMNGSLAPPPLTYLATSSETRRRWSLNGFGLNRYGPFSFSAANTLNSMTRRPWQRMPRTWQQQQRWNIRHASDAATPGRPACARSLPDSRGTCAVAGANEAQLQLAANVVFFSLPVSAEGKSLGTDVVPSLFSHSCRQHRHGRSVPQLAKRDPMQQAVKRTVYTVSAPTSPLGRPSELLSSTRQQDARTPLLPSSQEQLLHQRHTASSTGEADVDLGRMTRDAGGAEAAEPRGAL
ncbi:hypothetical protein JIQ42_07300 [Leishmania sp. Namibia]|uniref:hypothetical protein n=1 Tax=Leishmania sp. Namibia TaxID=2802991 RepID=UPI001B47C8D3|nr:hypothetical protein JIQ42_07300 [Leishmania sp. Namibia]